MQKFSLSPAPWTFSDQLYGIAHCLIDRDGRVIGRKLRRAATVN
jgi:hypothetical protein